MNAGQSDNIPLKTHPRSLGISKIVALASLWHACSFAPTAPEPPRSTTSDCIVELSSWPVLGWGRHLVARVDCPEVTGRLPRVVEYGQAELRGDYVEPHDPAFGNRIVRARARIGPPFGERRERREVIWDVSAEQCRRFLRPRLFSERYALTGPNSNSGLRAVIEDVGLQLPADIASGGGIVGRYPGIDLSPGVEVPTHRWSEYGLSTPLVVD